MIHDYVTRTYLSGSGFAVRLALATWWRSPLELTASKRYDRRWLQPLFVAFDALEPSHLTSVPRSIPGKSSLEKVARLEDVARKIV